MILNMHLLAHQSSKMEIYSRFLDFAYYQLILTKLVDIVAFKFGLTERQSIYFDLFLFGADEVFMQGTMYFPLVSQKLGLGSLFIFAFLTTF